jgi:hypothetical protein
MATTTTYGLNKPTVGGDENTWGQLTNDNWDDVDDLLDGTTAITPNLGAGWEVDGVAVTATAAELNILDGVTASTAELNILDGVTASTAELNILDGVTASAAELNVLDGIAGIASQVEAEAGTASDKLMTPERVAQAIDALATGSITLLGTLATTSGTSVTLSSLDLTGYKQLSIVCNGVSGSASAITNVLLNSTPIFRTAVSDQSTTCFGGATIDLGTGVFWSASLFTGSTNGPALGGQSGLTTASTSVTFTLSTGNFDAGSISIYGVK